MVADLQAIAADIDTGTEFPETSRALIVFNLTDASLSGVAVFRADMSWPADVLLPPITISEYGREIAPTVVTDLTSEPDRKGRPERRQLAFALRFAVRDVPAQGWRTYIATYTDEPIIRSLDANLEETPGLVVVETLRHAGTLPAVGTLAMLD